MNPLNKVLTINYIEPKLSLQARTNEILFFLLDPLLSETKMWVGKGLIQQFKKNVNFFNLPNSEKQKAKLSHILVKF